jgi:hypothetical protein
MRKFEIPATEFLPLRLVAEKLLAHQHVEKVEQYHALVNAAQAGAEVTTPDCVMTTETSNARGEWVLVPREIVDRFPEINPSNYDHGDACVLNAWGVELVRAVRDAAPPPAAARGDVRADLAALAREYRPSMSADVLHAWAADVVSALADEGVQAGEVEQRAPDVAMALHWIDRYAGGIDDDCQIDLVAEALGVTLPDGYALSQQPEARGVVDEAVAERVLEDYWRQQGGSMANKYFNRDQVAAMQEILARALTEARNVR